MASLIAWKNYATNAQITASSSAANLPPSNVANDSGSPSSGWQTAYGTTSASLTITPLSAGQTFDVLGIFRTNLTAAATVTFSIYSNSSVVFTDSVNPVAGYGQCVSYAGGVVGDYVTVIINDTSNPDGFLNVPLAFAGSAWIPQLVGVSYSSTVGRDAQVSETVSRGGQEYPTLFFQRRRWNVVMDAIRESEAWMYADPLMSWSAGGGNVLFIPEVEGQFQQQKSLFGRLKSSADFSYPYQFADRRRWSFTVTERL